MSTTIYSVFGSEISASLTSLPGSFSRWLNFCSMLKIAAASGSKAMINCLGLSIDPTPAYNREVTNYDNFNLVPNRLSFFQWNHCVITSATVSILY